VETMSTPHSTIEGLEPSMLESRMIPIMTKQRAWGTLLLIMF
jgi:hypothetical protein